MRKQEDARPLLTKAKCTVEARCRCGNKLKLKVSNDKASILPCPKCGWNIVVKAAYGIWAFTPKAVTDEQEPA